MMESDNGNRGDIPAKKKMRKKKSRKMQTAKLKSQRRKIEAGEEKDRLSGR